VTLPPGYFLRRTGQYDLLERVRGRMAWILPLTLGIVFVILYLSFRGTAQALISLTLLTLLVVPAVYVVWRTSQLGSTEARAASAGLPRRVETFSFKSRDFRWATTSDPVTAQMIADARAALRFNSGGFK